MDYHYSFGIFTYKQSESVDVTDVKRELSQWFPGPQWPKEKFEDNKIVIGSRK
jgi:hypothetical protein